MKETDVIISGNLSFLAKGDDQDNILSIIKNKILDAVEKALNEDIVKKYETTCYLDFDVEIF